MKPRIVTEPITGLRWVATTRGSAALAWLPAGLVLLALGLGIWIGRLTWGTW